MSRQDRIEMDERMDLKQKSDVSQEDRSRADMYNFLGLVLARPADEVLLCLLYTSPSPRDRG